MKSLLLCTPGDTNRWAVRNGSESVRPGDYFRNKSKTVTAKVIDIHAYEKFLDYLPGNYTAMLTFEFSQPPETIINEEYEFVEEITIIKELLIKRGWYIEGQSPPLPESINLIIDLLESYQQSQSNLLQKIQTLEEKNEAYEKRT